MPTSINTLFFGKMPTIKSFERRSLLAMLALTLVAVEIMELSRSVLGRGGSQRRGVPYGNCFIVNALSFCVGPHGARSCAKEEGDFTTPCMTTSSVDTSGIFSFFAFLRNVPFPIFQFPILQIGLLFGRNPSKQAKPFSTLVYRAIRKLRSDFYF